MSGVNKERLTMVSLKECLENRLDVIDDSINQMKDVIIKNLIDSNKKLQDEISHLRKKVNDIECNEAATNQYGRRNNLEISGVPSEVHDSNLEDKVVQILNKIDVNIQPNEIEACHRMALGRNQTGPKKVIVRFINRKNSEKAKKNAILRHKNRNPIDMDSLAFPEGTELFFNDNLNPFYKKLEWRCRTLKKSNFLTSFTYQNESFKIKFKDQNGQENSKKIINENQLVDLFPRFFNGSG